MYGGWVKRVGARCINGRGCGVWFRLYFFVVDGVLMVVFVIFVVRGKLCFFFTFGFATFAFFMV